MRGVKSIEGDDRAPMGAPWGIHARIDPTDHPERRTLILSVTDGPNPSVDFDAEKGRLNISLDDDDAEGTLLYAIGEAASIMADAAVENEAFNWIHEHETVYAVVGTTGEHADTIEWIVGCFLNRERCESFLRDLREWMHEREFDVPSSTESYHRAMGDKADCPDPKWMFDASTGTRYSVVEAPIDMGHAWCDSDRKDR